MIKNRILLFLLPLLLSSFIYPQIAYAADDYRHILVKRVVDGDTFLLGNGQRVRLIGIDTPELHVSKKLYRDAKRTRKDINSIQAQGELSYKFAKKMAEAKFVRVEFDIERYDKYGRLLGYVFLEDGTFVNAKIIEEGYANILTIPPNVKYQKLFLELERQARNSKKGLWKE